MMDIRKKLTSVVLVTAMASTGGVLATASPASAGPFDFCKQYPKACMFVEEEPRFGPFPPPECLSCPFETILLEDLYTLPVLTEQLVATQGLQR